jgi:hypothetical protein
MEGGAAGASDPRSIAEAAFASYLHRVGSGEKVDFDAFCGERPHLAGALRELHSVWRAQKGGGSG